MEGLKQFLSISSGDGSGDGYGYGSGDGYGDGSGDGYGYGYGYGDGYGDGDGSGSGDGYGDGYGSGSGDGSGDGYGDGSGDGSGDGYGDGDGVLKFMSHQVNIIDGTQTVITNIKGNIAKGFIINKDLTTKECYVAKVGNYFAHGLKIKEAYADALNKYTNNLPTEDRIKMFVEKFNSDKKYPANDFYEWHTILTGSCTFGKNNFIEQKGISLASSMYVKDFIELTESEYNGSVIKLLKSHY